MPLSLHIDPREEYLHVEVSGDFDLPGAKDLTRHEYGVAREHDLHKIFVDRRVMKGPGNGLHQFQYAEFLAKAQGTSNFRIVILKKVGLIGLDRFFENVAVNRGATLKVTTDPEEAFKWLEIKPPNNTAAAA